MSSLQRRYVAHLHPASEREEAEACCTRKDSSMSEGESLNRRGKKYREAQDTESRNYEEHGEQL